MNTDIHRAFINALLADACYVEGLVKDETGSDLAQDLKARLTKPLADYVGAHFKVITQHTEGDWFGSGFSVTVWQEKSNGQVYVSFRGTQGLADLATDIDLAINGTASAELAAMTNWYLRATSAEGTAVPQLDFQVDHWRKTLSMAARIRCDLQHE